MQRFLNQYKRIGIDLPGLEIRQKSFSFLILLLLMWSAINTHVGKKVCSHENFHFYQMNLTRPFPSEI